MSFLDFVYQSLGKMLPLLASDFFLAITGLSVILASICIIIRIIHVRSYN